MKIILKRQIADETEALRKTIREQKAHIEDLKRENSDLLFSLDEYTKKENSIMESIGYIEQKKREQNESLNKKYADEINKLRFFEQKWLNIVRNSDDPTLMAGVAFTRETLKACREEILHSTRRDLKITKDCTAAEEDFAAETVRLKTLENTKVADRVDFDALSRPKFPTRRDAAEPLAYPSAKGGANLSEWEDDFAEKFQKNFGVPLAENAAHRAASPVAPLRGDRNGTPAFNFEPGAETSVPADFPDAPCEPQTPITKTDARCNFDREDCRNAEPMPQSVSPHRFPARDTPAEPLEEPENGRSPKKMSDRDVVSLLEKLSV